LPTDWAGEIMTSWDVNVVNVINPVPYFTDHLVLALSVPNTVFIKQTHGLITVSSGFVQLMP